MISSQKKQHSARWQHMEHLTNSLHEAYVTLLCHQSMILAMNSSSVDPLQQYETQLEVTKKSFKMVFGLPSFDKGTFQTSDEDVKDLEILYRDILNLFEDTILILVSKDLYKLQILKTSIDAPCLGVLAAELSLLCSHADASVTQQASLGMYYLLCIAKHQSADSQRDNPTKQYEHGNHCFLTSDSEFRPEVLQQDKTKLAQCIGQSLSPSLLTDFMLHLLMKLSTSDQETASKAATVLKLTLKYHAQKVTRVCQMVDTIYKQLKENSSHFMKDILLEVVTLLAQMLPKGVVFQLMYYPVPADNALMLMWQAVGSEPQVAPQVLKEILLVLKDKPWEVEDTMQEGRCFILDVTNMMPLAASQALCMLLPMGSYKKTVAQFFPEILMALMFQLLYISQLRVQPQDRPIYAREGLRILLNCSGLQEVDTALKQKYCWSHICQTYYYQDGVNLIARTLCEYNFPQFPETLYYLHKILVQGPRRSEEHIIIVIFFIKILDKFFKDPLPELFLVLLRNWINDSNPEISKLSLQKITSMAPVVHKIENVRSLLTSILDAFGSKDETVVTQALLTLRRLVDKLDKVNYSSLCTGIASSYFHLMDHCSGNVRSLAIRHLAELIKGVSQHTSTLKHVLGGFAPFILCLEDRDTRVVSACKHTLAICDSQLEWSISTLFKEENYNFELVVLSICNNLLLSHESCITYLTCDALGFLGSSQVHLRRAAVILLGYLAELGGHLLFRDEIEVLIEATERMLQDEDSQVQELAEITHDLLKKIAHRPRSTTIKHAFQRLFKFSYTKEMKHLYNWQGTTWTVLNREEKEDQQPLYLPLDPPPASDL
ncbi:maestro heat-like repeat-containing protein family member 9 isoform X2 [Heterocephalus glaber]|uniref:Maestro heat-like repeat-containing protein family member 9 isoform X2 n=1 Tax=Heterocephalus glaber TaxID=10181 RepID=A0AAX6SSU1_HETGA|nr:maestro heat-like repeat-containing protein family member 9 isoform X2 [Heterocephalus glaber]